MKKALISLTFCFFMVMSISAAAQTDKPSFSGHESQTGQDISKSSPLSDTTQPQEADNDMSKHIQMMQEHIQKMNVQMEKIKAVTDPQKRQKLMEEHMASMMDAMNMMKSMPGCKMMSGGGMKAGGQGMMRMGMGMENNMKCHQMMEKKMEMMQSMIEGLIESSQMKK
jgi:GMP synthase PP-ATPase subunit